MTVALDHESRVSHADHAALRLWLRLFTCSLMVERTIRARLRERFGITLVRRRACACRSCRGG